MKKCDILLTNLQQYHFNGPTKLFSDLFKQNFRPFFFKILNFQQNLFLSV